MLALNTAIYRWIHENIKTVDNNYCINICTEIHENIKTVDKNYCNDKRDDFKFPIVNFLFICSNVATFQQHLHMEYMC